MSKVRTGSARSAAVFIAVIIVLFAAGYLAGPLIQKATTAGNVVNIEPFSPPEREGFGHYVGRDFYIYYPDKWTPQKTTGQASEIGLVSPHGGNDSLGESLLITSDFMSRNMSLRDYSTLSLLSLQTEVPGFSLEDAGPRKIGSIDGFEAVFTGNDSIHPPVKFMQAYVPLNQRVYVMTYTSREINFNRSLEDANMIIDSFAPIRQ